MHKFLEADAARDMLLSLPVSPAKERVALDDALNRVLAEDVYAGFPMPPFNKSPFDGYAFRGEETQNATDRSPAVFRLVGEIAAGDPAEDFMEPGTAVKIYTGAPMPPGANATIKFERTVSDGVMVRIPEAVGPGKDVIMAGEDYSAGTLLAEKGIRLAPAHLGVLASQGKSEVLVFRKPSVSVICTGNELSAVGEPRQKFGIYNSSYYSVSGYLRRLGFEIRYAGIVADDPRLIEERIAEQMLSADLVVTTGGASVGSYDYALKAAEDLGANILFWKVKMKPGGAILASETNGRLLLSLSGNPAAALMGLLIIAQPYLRRLCGIRDALTEEICLPLQAPLDKISTATRLLRGHLEVDCGRAFFVEHSGRGNGNLASFKSGDLIGEVPPGSGFLPAGTLIKAYRLAHDVC